MFKKNAAKLNTYFEINIFEFKMNISKFRKKYMFLN